jgi:hypothetical protein
MHLSKGVLARFGTFHMIYIRSDDSFATPENARKRGVEDVSRFGKET